MPVADSPPPLLRGSPVAHNAAGDSSHPRRLQLQAGRKAAPSTSSLLTTAPPLPEPHSEPALHSLGLSLGLKLGLRSAACRRSAHLASFNALVAEKETPRRAPRIGCCRSLTRRCSAGGASRGGVSSSASPPPGGAPLGRGYRSATARAVAAAASMPRDERCGRRATIISNVVLASVSSHTQPLPARPRPRPQSLPPPPPPPPPACRSRRRYSTGCPAERKRSASHTKRGRIAQT